MHLLITPLCLIKKEKKCSQVGDRTLTCQVEDQPHYHYTIPAYSHASYFNRNKTKLNLLENTFLLSTAVFPSEIKMALAPFGRGNSPTLRAPLGPLFYAL